MMEKSYDEYEFTLTTATPNRLIIKDETITWGRKENELKPQTIQLKSMQLFSYCISL